MDVFEVFHVFFKDIIFTLCELVFLTTVFLIIYIVIRTLFKKVGYISFFKKDKEYSEIILKKIKFFLIFIYIFLILALLGYNGYLIYKNIGVYQNAVSTVSGIPSEFWTGLLVGALKIILVSVAAHYFIKLNSKILDKAQIKSKAYKNLKSNNETIDNFFFRLQKIIKNSIIFLILIYAMNLLFFPERFINNMYVVLKIYLIASGGILLARAATVVVDSLEDLSKRHRYREDYLEWYNRLNSLLPLFRRCLEYIIYVWITSLAMLQISFFSKYVPFGTAAVQIIGIFFITRMVVEILKLFVDKYMMKSENELLNKQRRTLIPIMKSFLQTIVYFIALILTLRALKINPVPILAGAGIFSLVIGMGAQSLINDIVAGIFILFESIFLVGDYIETGSSHGVVESIFLRTTKIRDPNGQLHILRNGQINEVENYSKGYTFAVVEVGVAYDSDLEYVFQVLNDIGKRIKEKNPSVLEELVVRGIKEFGESELLIRTVTKVRPGHHLSVVFELRNMIKNEFDLKGIEIPFARRVVIIKNQSETEQKKNI
ncbi:mechanosensitive ion channel family protein [Psychrilyobacter piezotolerans]|uniref:Mechanosensitive ion channel family protein n=1 Tax=Psychrilyobacter piezotolerans TaxID=2293438 RepID=A0ABX9KJE7_9FUSO|nr:mechanosensitive ion channel family protein [Psychrilyobacter piezotolerans]MCS5421797.1 mechanosensitive ion channel family protein [Psychrilyobacter sp. S5]NDI77029.1 mechanosensitive ion channel family protein [Psychrilyobacter piezotolerans]RDE64646.1 mechanosensitive ion channel family protein [Psychrilyobacter sp. S5]REI42458.1 mechanosensitive ion channel family protein [Psychrilyobacter piezotolerans]